MLDLILTLIGILIVLVLILIIFGLAMGIGLLFFVGIDFLAEADDLSDFVFWWRKGGE